MHWLSSRPQPFQPAPAAARRPRARLVAAQPAARPAAGAGWRGRAAASAAARAAHPPAHHPPPYPPTLPSAPQVHSPEEFQALMAANKDKMVVLMCKATHCRPCKVRRRAARPHQAHLPAAAPARPPATRPCRHLQPRPPAGYTARLRGTCPAKPPASPPCRHTDPSQQPLSTAPPSTAPPIGAIPLPHQPHHSHTTLHQPRRPLSPASPPRSCLPASTPPPPPSTLTRCSPRSTVTRPRRRGR